MSELANMIDESIDRYHIRKLLCALIKLDLDSWDGAWWHEIESL